MRILRLGRRWLARWAVRLYPARWRARYGEEFQALLEECGEERLAVGDVVKEGLAMQIRSLGERSPLGVVMAAGAMGTVAMLLWALMQPVQYRAHALLDGVSPERLRDVVRPALSRSALLGVMERHGLYADERRSRPAEEVVSLMQRRIRIASTASTTAFEISFLHGDVGKAEAVARELRASLLGRMDGAVGSLAITHVRPNYLELGFGGLCAGALAGGLVLLLRRVRLHA